MHGRMTNRTRIECPICIDTFTQRGCVSCPFCQYSTCKKCAETYMFSTMDDAACMNPECQRRWDREVLLRLFSSQFVNQRYKKHREDVLLDRERSMLTATLPYVELERQRRVAAKKATELTKQRQQLRCEIDRITHELFRCQRIINQVEPSEGSGESSCRRAFLQRCTHGTCTGWLNSSYRCTVCERYTCPKCLAALGCTNKAEVAHECREEDVASVAMIKTDSTPCPQCGVRVFRVSGCNAMWCTQCRCSFDYRTGKKVNGVIHNPHYFEFMRDQGTSGRQMGDVPCGGCPSIHELATAKAPTFYFSVLRFVRHVEHDEMPRYAQNDTDNRRYRVMFMLNDITEQEFKGKIQRQEKLHSKRTDIVMVFEMLVHTISEELRQFVVRTKTESETTHAIQTLIEYANKAFQAVSARYGQVAPYIRPNLILHNVRDYPQQPGSS